MIIEWMQRRNFFNLLLTGMIVIIWITLTTTSLFAIVSFEQGMQPRFELKKFPQADLLKTSYEYNNYAVAPIHKTPLIPKIIHQIWVGGALPEKFKKFTSTWIAQHPDWEYRLWTDEDIDSFEFTNKILFDLATNKGTKADIWRYEILYKYGGVYLDTDYECIRPLNILHHTCKFYVVADEQIIGNGIIGCVPKHPIVQECIKKIGMLSEENLKDPWTYTGPILITKCVNRHLWKTRRSRMDKTVVYPSMFFHPFPNIYRHAYWQNKLDRSFIESFLIPETFAIHFWATSWVVSE